MQVGGSASSLIAQLAQATQANRAENIRAIEVLNQNLQQSKESALQFSIQQQSDGARVKGAIIDVIA